jgi:aminoglycoside phosphotransferase (APT) family kinase protein
MAEVSNTETRPVRAGEEIDPGRLADYLRAGLGIAGSISIEQFPAGSSNLTYLVRIDQKEFVLRRPPFGNTVKTAHDMRREFEVLSKLSAVYRPAPKPLLFCYDENVIGSEFYLMERRRGLVIRGIVPNELSESAELQQLVCRSFIANLVELHSLDFNAVGLGDLGKPEGYCKRQVEGWTKRYFAARTHEWPQLESAIDWLGQNFPVESGSALIHNDYKFDNVMLDPADLTRITAVLDWEMVTIGDPLMDLGTTLGYWMSADASTELLNMPFNPRVLMENISRQDMVDMYEAASGQQLPDMLFYYVFGTFKIVAIYARYAKGLT